MPASPASAATPIVGRLAHNGGLGVTGLGTNALVRTVLVELLTRTKANIVTTSAELTSLFEGRLDQSLQARLAPRLQVCELLEEAIEYLEWEMLIDDAEQQNPDLVADSVDQRPWTYWIAAPGRDDDVVLPLVRRGTEHRLTGIMIGRWAHGTTCAIDLAGSVATIHENNATRTSGPQVSVLTVGEAISRLGDVLAGDLS